MDIYIYVYSYTYTDKYKCKFTWLRHWPREMATSSVVNAHIYIYTHTHIYNMYICIYI